MNLPNHPPSILLAEADRTAMLAHVRELEAAGYSVLTAGDGLACVDRLRTALPDLLVLDAEIPWGGGDGVLAVCQEESPLQPIPTIVMVARRNASLLYRLAQYAVGDLLFKPVAPGKLAERAGELLAQRGETPYPVSPGLRRLP
mgnify:FL=1